MYTEDFTRWWFVYPKQRRVGKKACFPKWRSAVYEISEEKGISLKVASEWLLERTGAFAKSDKGMGEFCPMPLTWLNQGRWDDDPAAWDDRGGHVMRIERYKDDREAALEKQFAQRLANQRARRVR